MVYVRNTSKTRHISARVSSDCSSDNSNAKHAEVDIPPFKTVNLVLGGECGVGSMEIRTVEARYADKNSSEYVSPREDDITDSRVWWKGVIPLEVLGTVYIFPERQEVFSDNGSTKILIPNDLGNVKSEEYFTSLLEESERGAEEESKAEVVSTSPQLDAVTNDPTPSPTQSQSLTSRFNLPSFSTLIKILLVILGVIGAFWYIMKNKKKLSPF